MHLAIVSPYPPAITGIGQYGYHVSGTLARSGVFDHITLLTGRTVGTPTNHAPPNVKVERVWQPGYAGAGLQLAARLCQLRPDLVWFNLGATAFGRSTLANLSGLLVPFMIQRLGFPSVLTMHEMPELADLRLLQAPGGPLGAMGAHWVTWALTRADVICLTLKHYADWLAERQPEARTMHIPIGMYGEPQLLDEPAGPELLFFTTLAPFKGLELLLEAFRLLQARIPRLRLTVAGAEHPRFPGYTARVRQRYQDLTAVRWLGYVPEPDVREVFRQCQVVVLPYTAATGSSSVLYQAVSCGRSVVASNLPELRSAVAEAGLHAEFFANGNVEELAAAMGRLLGAPELRRDEARWNYQAICRRRLDETCRAYLDAFNLALGLHSAPSRIRVPPDITAESA